jgi:carbonic anhydrase
MSTIETLADRNRDFATNGFTSQLPMMPKLKTMVIACADPRVDPAHVLGLEPGDAVVIRNVGGRITPATLQTMAMLRLVAGSENAAGPGWSLIILHHTDCGINHLAGYPDLLAEHFGISADELDSKHITNPHQSVKTDVELIKGNPFLPAEFLVSGLVYDVATGLIEEVCGPEILRREPDVG